MNRTIPTIYCKEEGGQLIFLCEHCKAIHSHGAEEGHRVAHCINPKSPYHETGYNLKIKT